MCLTETYLVKCHITLNTSLNVKYVIYYLLNQLVTIYDTSCQCLLGLGQQCSLGMDITLTTVNKYGIT